MMSRESYVIHGDLHANNVLVPTSASAPIQFIDWQSVRLGSPAHDLSYLLISSMASEPRQRIETSMLTALATATNPYGQAIDWQAQYALGGLFNLLVLAAGFQLRQHKFTASHSLFVLLERCLTFIQQHKPMSIG